MTHHRPDARKSLAYGLGAVAMWATVATAFKLSLKWVGTAELVAGAVVCSTLVLGVVLAVRKTLGRALSSLRHHYLTALCRGTLNPVLYYLVLFEAYDRLPARVALCINYTWPIALSGLSTLASRRTPRPREWALMVLGYGGVVLIAVAGAGTEQADTEQASSLVANAASLDTLGLVLAFLSSFLWASYWELSRRDQRPPTDALFQNFLVVTPLALLLPLFHSSPALIQHPLPVLAGMAYVGTFEMGLTFVIWQGALLHSPNVAKTSTLMFISPFASLALVHFVLGESLPPLTFAGLAMISLAVGLQKSEHPHRHKTKAAKGRP